ncbi:DsbA family protein [Alkalicaulis satelles]|uniref:DsbA family protein n=1 Tax=Alkalicaulis satelles TaxID=2609175 RepID=A0A5M6ZIL0_9PROT|nr:DsbA family protein [Alkalicaulis satelles]KAA5804666.1 DsbA family protein [Alkalicaulis satelles]
MIRFLGAAALALTVSACGEAADPEAERAEIETVVREYILANPEIIEEALVSLQRRAEARETEAREAALPSLTDALFGDARDPFLGAADAPVTVVEFTDYACGFCKRAQEWKDMMLALHPGQVRFVHKTLPLRGSGSDMTAMAALSVWEGQRERYQGFHEALMAHRGEMTPEELSDIAQEAGVDVADMLAGMESEAVDGHLDRAFELANQLSLRGTPMFLFEDGTIIPGYAPPALTAAVQEALDAAQ